MSWSRSVALLGLFAVGCSPDTPTAWNQAEWTRRAEELGHIGEAADAATHCEQYKATYHGQDDEYLLHLRAPFSMPSRLSV